MTSIQINSELHISCPESITQYFYFVAAKLRNADELFLFAVIV